MVAGTREVVGRPFGQWILRRGSDSQQLAPRRLVQSLVQFFDDIEIGDQRSQFGR
jgi:hypothetical protein